MRLLICAGGTGGGVYPAQSILQALGKRVNATLWVGGKGGMEADLVSRLHVPYAEISAAGLHGVGIRSLPGNLVKLAKGILESQAILKQFKPDVMLFTGGFLAVPMALAGRKIKSLLYVPDIEPGLALKALANMTDVIALTTNTSKRYFKSSKRLVVCGYPTRNGLNLLNKTDARKHFGLSNDLPVLMVMGGSKGAHSINNAILAHLAELLEFTQVIHITGSLDWEEIKQRTSSLEAGHKSRYRAFPFLHEEIAQAFSSADLLICRAGASTLGELPLFGLPAILVPYPYAWRYQKVNAEYLVDHGGALMIKNDELDEKLLNTVKSLLVNHKVLDEMCEKMRALSTPAAADSIANLLLELGNTPGKGKGF